MQMKSKYEKTYRWWRQDIRYAYDIRWGGYGRNMRTFPEQRRNAADVRDPEIRFLQVKGIKRRGYGDLDPWNIEPPVARQGGANWKEYTKHEKQWGVGFDRKAAKRVGRIYFPPAYRKPGDL
jgi:hypothetical protein